MDSRELAEILERVRHRQTTPDGSETSRRELLEFIQSQPELAVYEGHQRLVAGGGRPLSHADLVNWLIKRTVRESPEVVVHRLEDDLRSDKVPYQVTAALVGADVKHPFDLGGGMQLIPYNEKAYWQGKESPWGPICPTKRITSALTCEFRIPRSFAVAVSPAERRKQAKDREGVESLIEQARLCVSLAEPFPTWIVAWRFKIPDEIPPGGGGGGILDESAPHFGRGPLSEEALTRAKEIHEQFLKLDTKGKNRLLVPMERLDKAMRGMYVRRRSLLVDTAIDLGVAFESMLVTDGGQGEITYKLSNRGAWLLGRDPAHRLRIMKMLRGIYRLRSLAAHTGRLPDKPVGLGYTAEQLLGRGNHLAAEAIEMLIHGGGIPEPEEWDEFVLSGDVEGPDAERESPTT